ncbi:MAG: DUF89 family protein [Asgard group archaeon]|nr:DUF89 family protein [Asgard group archaeon]
MPHENCFDCLVEISERAINLSTNDLKKRKELLDNLKGNIKKDFNEIKLPDYSNALFSAIAKETGVLDPFLEIKRISNKQILEIAPQIVDSISGLDTKEKLYRLFLYSIGANMVDFSTGGHTIDLSKIAEQILDFHNEKLIIDEFQKLFEMIIKAKEIIFLSDNCGEVVIDNLIVDFLHDSMKKEVYLGLKGAPVANDCTLDDFNRDNIPVKATENFAVSNSFGYNLNQTSERFKELLDIADLLVVKGQSNYETTLNNLLRYPSYKFPPIFCVLRTKCQVITNHLGVPLGSNIIKQMNPMYSKEKEKLTEIVDC